MKQRLKIKIPIYACGKCGGSHAAWWKTTEAPSCAERQARQ